MRSIKKHNLSVGGSYTHGKNFAMKFKPRKLFLKGENVYAVYRKIPFSRSKKSEHTKLKGGKFIWSDGKGMELAVYETPTTTASTHTSFFVTKRRSPGRYYVEYISNDDTSVHEKVSFIIYQQLPEVAELKQQYMTKIIEILNKSPTSIDDLKKACGVPI